MGAETKYSSRTNMAVLQMTRAEYQTKYGAPPPAIATTAPASKVDTTPSPTKMTRAEYQLKYGAPAPTPTPPPTDGAFGDPLADINRAGADVHAAIDGEGQYAGQGAIRRGFSAAESAATAIPTVASDVIPGGKPVLNAVSSAFGAATKFAGTIQNTLATLAEKAGIMSPEERAQYDKNNEAFAGTPLGHAIDATASVANSAGNIANVILMAHGVASGIQDFAENKLPAIKEKVTQARDTSATQVHDAAAQAHTQVVQDYAKTIADIENGYQKGRTANDYSKDAGTASRERIASTNVLRYATNENGVIRTTQSGGPVDQYRAMTVKPAEGVVRSLLEKEGTLVNLSDVATKLHAEIMKSGLEGADLTSALNGVNREIGGLRLRADENGYIPSTLLHDAKINTTNNINYQTPPETATYRKAVARGYKSLVEENSSYAIKDINAELAKFYDDIGRLERLDGMRVQGGKLGKYGAQISGNITGAMVGILFGGPIGAAIGAAVGGEMGSVLKGKSMAGTFKNVPDAAAPKSPVLEQAVQEANAPAAPSALSAPPQP